MGLHILALAGGSGTRLWPLSRRATPKHLLPLGPGGTTLLRATVERIHDLGDSVSVVTAASQVPLVRSALQGLDHVRVIAEPSARGTGPALGLATRTIAREDPDAIIVSVHADAYVGDVDDYRAAVIAAAGWARASGGLATVGLTPTYPATGMGYIAIGDQRDNAAWRLPSVGVASASAAYVAAAHCRAYVSGGFVEKPPLDVAQAYVADGRHLWNLGLFAWPVATFERELGAADAHLANELAAMVEERVAGDEAAANARYERMTPVAVEPLVFERTPQLTVVRATFAWSDVGAWNDLRDVRTESGDADAQGNVTDGDVVIVDSTNSMVRSGGGRLVAVVGMRDTVVIDTGDAVLVMPADRAQDVKTVVEELKASQQTNLL